MLAVRRTKPSKFRVGQPNTKRAYSAMYRCDSENIYGCFFFCYQGRNDRSTAKDKYLGTTPLLNPNTDFEGILWDGQFYRLEWDKLP